MIDTEPYLAAMLEARKKRRSEPPYIPQEDDAIQGLLEAFFTEKVQGARISGIGRIGGGASKEQFAFTLTPPGGEPARYLLRMDPMEAITETSREREFEILSAFEGIVPVPRPVWMDPDATTFPRPAMIMELVRGTTKPSSLGLTVTGLGTVLGERLRKLIRPQYLDILAKVHNFDWRSADLPSFAAPTDDPKQATRWLINFWNELLEQDVVAHEPVMRLATQYLQQNIPDCEELALVHGDFRTGNYLFDEESGEVTALLDWEMCYIGDPHADYAWLLAPVFGTKIDGVFRASDIFEGEEDFIRSYEEVSGRQVDRKKLHYFKIFNYWKSYILVSVLGMRAAKEQHNHQDVLLTFLAGTGPMHLAELTSLLSMGEPQ